MARQGHNIVTRQGHYIVSRQGHNIVTKQGGLISPLIREPLLHGLNLGLHLVHVPALLLLGRLLRPELPELGPPNGSALRGAEVTQVPGRIRALRRECYQKIRASCWLYLGSDLGLGLLEDSLLGLLEDSLLLLVLRRSL